MSNVFGPLQRLHDHGRARRAALWIAILKIIVLALDFHAEGGARDVLAVELDGDVILASHHGHVGHFIA